MREEFILNIYKNDEWAPLWAVEDKAQRVLGIMFKEMRLRGLGLGRVGMEKLKFSHKGGWCANFSHKGGGCAKFSHRALFTRANAKLDSFKWP